MDIETAKAKLEEQLLQLPGVIGVGIGEKAEKTVFMVYINGRISQFPARKAVPQALDGYEIVLEEIGNVKALPGK